MYCLVVCSFVSAVVGAIAEQASNASLAHAEEASSGHPCTKEDVLPAALFVELEQPPPDHTGISGLASAARIVEYSVVGGGNFDDDPLGHYLAICRLDNEPPDPVVIASLAPAAPAAPSVSTVGGWQRNRWHSSWHQGPWHGWHNA